MCTYIKFFRVVLIVVDTINCQTCVQKTHRRWHVCAHRNCHKACTFTQTFDAILYLNKCSCAPISVQFTVWGPLVSVAGRHAAADSPRCSVSPYLFVFINSPARLNQRLLNCSYYVSVHRRRLLWKAIVDVQCNLQRVVEDSTTRYRM